MNHNYGILFVLFFPVVGGMIGFCLGRKGKDIRNSWIDFVVVVESAVLAYLGYMLLGKQAGISIIFQFFPEIKCSLSLDGLRVLLCMTTAVLFAVAVQFMKKSMQEEMGSNRFYLLYMGMFSMILGVILADDFFCFLIFIMLAFLCAYPLLCYRQDEKGRKNARVYVIFLAVALILILVGTTIVYDKVGGVGYTEVKLYAGQMLNEGSPTVYLGGLALFTGFAIFAGIFPVQFQVTKGTSHSMLEVSAILSCLISKLGIWGIMILAVSFFLSNILYGRVLLIAGLLTMIWGLLITLSSTDIRKILMGLNIVTNGFLALDIALIVLSGGTNTYAVYSSIFLLIAFSLCLFALYMIALEQVYKVHTYEINGLIASGKENKRLAFVCFLSGASLVGVPGTLGFLAYSALFHTLISDIKWKWLTVLCILLWAFFMTAVVRFFMKLFISKKEESMQILTTREERKRSEDVEKAEENRDERINGGISENRNKKAEGNLCIFGEVILLGISVIQIAAGIFPYFISEQLRKTVMMFSYVENKTGTISYFTEDVLIGFGVAVLLAAIFYLNLVYGILLRTIRNKKNKKLKESL